MYGRPVVRRPIHRRADILRPLRKDRLRLACGWAGSLGQVGALSLWRHFKFIRIGLAYAPCKLRYVQCVCGAAMLVAGRAAFNILTLLGQAWIDLIGLLRRARMYCWCSDGKTCVRCVVHSISVVVLMYRVAHGQAPWARSLSSCCDFIEMVSALHVYPNDAFKWVCTKICRARSLGPIR